MRRCFSMLALVACTLPLAAAEPFFVDAANQDLPPPPPDKAQVVFLEPVNKIQGGIPVGIWSMNGPERTLLAVTGAQTKALLLFEPGQHRLMSTNMLTKGHLLDMNLDAGKRYYVLVRFIYKEGFQLRPIRTTTVSDFNMVGDDWKEWIAKTPRFVAKTAAADEHFGKPRLQKRLDKLYADAVAAWEKRTDAERAELLLTSADAAPP
jgi:hypothetical protein